MFARTQNHASSHADPLVEGIELGIGEFRCNTYVTSREHDKMNACVAQPEFWEHAHISD